MASWWASIWPHQPTVALLVWSVVLFVGTVWQAQCGHSAYDRSLSTSDCTVLRGQPDICVTPPALCLSAWTIKVVTLGSASKWLVQVGPALTWLPLLHHAIDTNEKQLVAWIVFSAIAWLGLSMPLRFTHLAVGWDPSGHVLLAGLQLVPTWMTVSHWRNDRGIMRSAWSWSLVVAELVTVALACMTANTAAFFHSTSEVMSAWAVVVGLFVFFFQRLHFERLADKRQRFRIVSRARKLLRVASGVCCVSALLAWWILQLRLGTLLPFLAHDAVLALSMGAVIEKVLNH